MTAGARGPKASASRDAHPRESIGAAFGLIVLAIVGHACSLGLIDVRAYSVFQHYQPWTWIARELPRAGWGILVQLAIVSWLVWRHRAAFVETTLGALSARAWVVVIGLVGFSLVVPAEGVSRTLGEIALAGGLCLVAATNLWLAVLMLPADTLARAEAWVTARITLRSDAAGTRPWDPYLVGAVALWVTVLASGVSLVVLERVPHIDDSISNYFQARYFAAGRLYLPAPPDAPSFQVDQTVIDSGKWYGYAFPVWPAVLAIGVRFGVPWLVNPILGGLLILVGHALVRRRFDRATANGVALMLSVSPWLIFMSAEFMPHPLTGVLVLLAALAVDHAISRGPRWKSWAVLAGLASGALMLTRAIDGFIVPAALGATVLVDRRVARALPALLLAGVVAAAMAALIFPYNKAVTGRATYPPHMAWSDGHWGPGVDRLGFGPDVGIRAWPNLDPLPGHGPADVVLNANKNVFMTNVDLFGWAAGSLIFVWFALALGEWHRRDALMLSFVVAFVAGYSVYWFSGGPDLGARYWYPLLVPFAALTARGAQMAAARLQAGGRLTHAGARIGAFIAVSTVSAAIVMVPWRASTKHYRYRGIGGEVRQLAAARRFEHAIVFVRGEASRRDFASAFNLNPWTLDDPATVYALDAGLEHRAAVVSHFADRPVWVIGRARSDQPIEVLTGPLAPGTVPR